MEMRRLGAASWSIERWLLFGYKILAGYGLRAYRSLATYAALVFGFAWLLHSHTGSIVSDTTKAAGSGGLHFAQFWDCVAISFRSTVSFLSPVTEGLTALGTGLFVGMKIAGPLMLGLAALSMRSRVQR
jgi:hypothetical protein